MKKQASPVRLIAERFDSRTLANMEVALDRACKILPAGSERHEARRHIASRILQCANGGDLTLYVLDSNEKPVNVESGSAKAQVLVDGRTHNVEFKPAGGNTLKATGEFTARKGMKVIVTTTKVGGQSFQARLAPLH